MQPRGRTTSGGTAAMQRDATPIDFSPWCAHVRLRRSHVLVPAIVMMGRNGGGGGGIGGSPRGGLQQ